MANRTVQLYKYIKLPDLGWRYCKAVFYPNNRVKPHVVMTLDGEQTIKDGYYCLSYNRKWEPARNDPADAERLLMKKRGELLTVANGGTVVQAAEEDKVSGSLQSAFEAWVTRIYRRRSPRRHHRGKEAGRQRVSSIVQGEDAGSGDATDGGASQPRSRFARLQ